MRRAPPVRRRSAAALAAALVAVKVIACGDMADEASVTPGPSDASPPPPRDAGAGTVPANGVYLVHAAEIPAFRICFDGRRGAQPAPTADLMPGSNVVGVEVGTAVRLEPLAGPLGRAWVFPEAVIRRSYPTGGGDGPSCEMLLTSAAFAGAAIEVGEVTEDLSFGVHLLVVRGCLGAEADPEASVTRCGADWSAPDGNMAIAHVPLQAYGRPASDALPVQIVQLSSALALRAEGRPVGVGVGEVEAGVPAPLFEGLAPFGTPVPEAPLEVPLDLSETTRFATHGLFLTLAGQPDAGDAGDPDAGDRELVLVQSLADVQRFSAPTALPPAWYAAGSSYVVLVVGDPDAAAVDGGAASRRALHMLAVPLAAPQDAADAAAED
jgi:hypothetical protein